MRPITIKFLLLFAILTAKSTPSARAGPSDPSKLANSRSKCKQERGAFEEFAKYALKKDIVTEFHEDEVKNLYYEYKRKINHVMAKQSDSAENSNPVDACQEVMVYLARFALELLESTHIKPSKYEEISTSYFNVKRVFEEIYNATHHH